MTKISYVHGIPRNEFLDRSKRVQKRVSIPLNSMSRGQLRLELMLDQVKILRAFYPEMAAEYDAAARVIQKAMRGESAAAVFAGFHPTSATIEVLDGVKKAIALMPSPAMGGHIDKFEPNRHIGEIPASLVTPPEYIRVDVGNAPSWVPNPQYASWKKEREEKARLLDKEWTKASYHTLYEFVKTPNSETPVVAAKTVQHKQAIGSIASWIAMNRDDLQLWQRNEIMRRHTEAGTSPEPPETALATLKTNGSNSTHIGIPLAVLVPIIITCFNAAVLGAVKIISAVKARNPNDQLLDNLKYYGGQDFSGSTEDWYTGSSGNGGGQTGGNSGGGTTSPDNTNLLLFGGGLVAAMLLFNDKN